MDRRRFMKSTIGLCALGLSATPVSAREEGELPQGDVSVSRVLPFRRSEAVAGDWIHHQYGWAELCSSSEENRRRVQEFFDSFDPVVKIDGERIENPEQYYGEVQSLGEDDRTGNIRWAKIFNYYTPPKSVGEHSFRFEQHFTSDFLVVDAGPRGDLCSENELIEAGDVIVMDEPYVVSPEGRGGR